MNKLFTGKELMKNGAKCNSSFTVHVEQTKRDKNGNTRFLVTLYFNEKHVFQKVKGFKTTKNHKYIIHAYPNLIEYEIINLINSISDDDSVMLDFTENL